jgi:hypothetical protein
MRHPSNIPIEVIERGSPERENNELHNVSFGGLSFNAPTPLELGSVVAVRIAFVRPVFSTTARVAWCAKVDGHFEIGVEFLEATDVFRARMVEQVCHIEHHRQQVLKNEGRVLSSEQAAMEWIATYAATFPQAD